MITGGGYGERIVTEQNEDGFYRKLPELNTGRYGHGCSSYLDDDFNIVRNEHLKFNSLQ